MLYKHTKELLKNLEQLQNTSTKFILRLQKFDHVSSSESDCEGQRLYSIPSYLSPSRLRRCLLLGSNPGGQIDISVSIAQKDDYLLPCKENNQFHFTLSYPSSPSYLNCGSLRNFYKFTHRINFLPIP